MLFKPQNYYKIYRDWPTSYERDYDYSPWDNRLFHSLEIISLYETNEWVFLHRDNEPEYGTDAYKKLQKELKKLQKEKDLEDLENSPTENINVEE